MTKLKRLFQKKYLKVYTAISEEIVFDANNYIKKGIN